MYITSTVHTQLIVMEANQAVRLLLLCVTILFIDVTEAGRLCGACTHVTDPRDCNQVIICGTHEVCMVTSYISTSGHLLYDLGCMDSLRCSSKRQLTYDNHAVEERDFSQLTVCRTCCNGTDVCNVINGLCNASPLDTTGSILCFSCNQMHSPDECDSITRCPENQKCYLGQRLNHLSGHVVWESRCGSNNTECSDIVAHPPGFIEVGRRQLNPAYRETCCSHKNFCNNKCTRPTSPPITAPPPTETVPKIIYMDSPGSVCPGTSLLLQCLAYGSPPPVIHWRVLTSYNNLPNNIRIERGNLLSINSFQAVNAGRYECWAENVAGNATQSITITLCGKATTATRQVQTSTVPSTTPHHNVQTSTLKGSQKPSVLVHFPALEDRQIGDNVTLRCIATGIPAPKIDWSIFVASGIPDNVQIVKLPHQSELDLLITNLRQDNYGNYACRAVNPAGKDMQFINLSPYS